MKTSLTQSSHSGTRASTDSAGGLVQPLPSTAPPALSFPLRDYQIEAVQKTLQGWKEFDRLLGIAPTGSGKTRIFSAITRGRLKNGRVLILAHREELISQAIHKLWRDEQIAADKEKAEQRARLEAAVVVGSVQTFRADRRARFPVDHFSTIIVDEGHHVLADSYQSILSYFQGTKVFGCTATPDRGDRRNLAVYFEQIAFEISLPDMIRAGWLCPIKVKTVPLEIDISRVGMRAGDYSEEEIAVALEPVLQELAGAIKAYAFTRKTLVFLPLVRTADQFASILQNHGLPAESICGESPNRKEILARFDSGDTRFLCNAMLLNEGFDCPCIDCVVCLRPTTIRSLFSQQVGRGTRIHPGKENLLLLDFLWLSREHNLVRPASLIARDEVEQAQIEAQLGAADGDLLEAEGLSRNWRHNTLNTNELYEKRLYHLRVEVPNASSLHKSQGRRYL
jgi:superfamily II DNA or RNA helicase